MFHEIDPESLDLRYKQLEIKADDIVINYQNGQMLLNNDQKLMTYQELLSFLKPEDIKAVYLLTVKEQRFFWSNNDLSNENGVKYESIRLLRTMEPKYLAFATVTAIHLANWYQTNRYCGRCGHEVDLGETDRKVVCPNCHLEVFPRISPAVIIGVRHQGKLLLTKYTNGYDHYALIAGFVEIGETVEDAVRREVFEETGMRVKNMQYFASQPWGFSSSILMGFYVDLDEEGTYDTDKCKLDRNELSEIRWFEPDEIPEGDSQMSLTWTMIYNFASRDN